MRYILHDERTARLRPRFQTGVFAIVPKLWLGNALEIELLSGLSSPITQTVFVLLL
jgi:hypothetical protein